VASKNQFTYEKQARLSVALAAIGGLATVTAIVLIIKNFALQTFWTAYSPKSLWLPAFLGTLLIAGVAGFFGLLVGFNGAGQKRNTESKLSWTGFFASAAVITLVLIAAAFFYFTRFPLAR
jgi:hypothetical protein